MTNGKKFEPFRIHQRMSSLSHSSVIKKASAAPAAPLPIRSPATSTSVSVASPWHQTPSASAARALAPDKSLVNARRAHGGFNVLFIGNPGVGKSTLLNGLIGAREFKAGVSISSGLTSVLHAVKRDDVVYMDTPGLDDVDKRKQAASEIEKALKQGGDFRVCFVVTTTSGRIHPSDVATIQLVAEAVEVKFSFSIIVNKVSGAVMARQEELFDSITRLVEGATGRRPSQILVGDLLLSIALLICSSFRRFVKTTNSAITTTRCRSPKLFLKCSSCSTI